MANRADRSWKIILSVLCALAVVLIVAIFIVKNLNQKPDEQENTYPATIHTVALEEINAQAATMSIDEARALYEEVIANAETELDKAQAQVEYGRYLLNHNLDEEGLNKLLTVDAEVLGPAYKMLLYAALRDYFSEINNEELANQYNDMIREAIINSDYAAGG